MLSKRESNPHKLYRLACFEEAAGILYELTENEGIIVAHLGKIHLALPLDMEGHLRPLIGQKIAILRTDIPDKTYLIRALSEESEKTEE